MSKRRRPSDTLEKRGDVIDELDEVVLLDIEVRHVLHVKEELAHALNPMKIQKYK